MIRNLAKRLVYRYGQFYHKIKISRSPQDSVILMIKDTTSVEQFLGDIRASFPSQNRQLITAANFDSNLQNVKVDEEAREYGHSIMDKDCLQLLISNSLFVYETFANKVQFLFGIECLEFGNNFNHDIPQAIAQSIVNFYVLRDQSKTVTQFISLPQYNSESDLIAQKQQMNATISKVVTNTRRMNQLKAVNPVKNFINKMSVIMGTNWIFLYIITFGYYGWDVGEPISYLTAVGVDLFAMLGLFDLQKKLNDQFQLKDGKYAALLNLASLKKHQKWAHCYLRRQIN